MKKVYKRIVQNLVHQYMHKIMKNLHCVMVGKSNDMKSNKCVSIVPFVYKECLSFVG